MSPGRTERFEQGQVVVEDPDRDVQYTVWGIAPVQALGTVLGRDLYFRARHNLWSFEIADHKGELPSDGRAEADGYYREAKYPDAGWMTGEVAMRIIERCLRDYLGVG
jgi:hypothetical protein